MNVVEHAQITPNYPREINRLPSEKVKPPRMKITVYQKEILAFSFSEKILRVDLPISFFQQ